MDKLQTAHDLAVKLLDMMGAQADISAEVKDGRVRVNASVGEAGFLIGRDGENLRALQHILGLMTAKKTGEITTPSNFVFDINNYHREREDYLAAAAKSAACRVLENGQAVELDPMPPADRRVVHLTVEKIEGVKSESAGEGEERRVIIKPAVFQ